MSDSASHRKIKVQRMIFRSLGIRENPKIPRPRHCWKQVSAHIHGSLTTAECFVNQKYSNYRGSFAFPFHFITFSSPSAILVTISPRERPKYFEYETHAISARSSAAFAYFYLLEMHDFVSQVGPGKRLLLLEFFFFRMWSQTVGRIWNQVPKKEIATALSRYSIRFW